MRILVPIFAVLVAVTAFILYAMNAGSPESASDPAPDAAKTAEVSPEASEATPGSDTSETAADPVADAAVVVEQAAAEAIGAAGQAIEQAAAELTPPAPTQTLRILTVTELDEREAGSWTDEAVTLGSTDIETGFLQAVTLHRFGAAVDRVAMSEYNTSVSEDADPYVVLDKRSLVNGAVYRHFAARRLWINKQEVTAAGIDGRVYNVSGVWWARSAAQTSGDTHSVTFMLAVVDQAGDPFVDVYRTYSLKKGSYDLKLDQRIVNRSDAEQAVRFEQLLQADIEPDVVNYMGDRRQVVTGVFSPSKDPDQVRVYTDGGFHGRAAVIKKLNKGKAAVWPDADNPTDTLAWLATENRYFAVATHTDIAETITETSGVEPLTNLFPQIQPIVDPFGPDVPEPVLAFVAQSPEVSLAPGAEHAINIGVFTGPRTKTNFTAHPYDLLHFGQMIKYELGCTICTFQWLAKGLLGFLKFIHGFVGDWGVAIIVLVLCVRAVLHPITKKSQVNMMVFGKQMQAVQPEMEKLKKKYEGDAAGMQREQMRLWREHGINPLRMLGCLPMFLQMPIWVALYAMIYYAVELWQQPAFYGVFQAAGLNFLGDLAVPDRLIVFTDTPIHLFGFKMLDFSSFNVLPIVWTFINIINMKLTQPPAATEQAAQQQKIMRFMMVLFAFWLYSAPAALTLYMCASTSIGIIDATLVRRHVKKMEEEGTLLPAKKTGGDGDNGEAKPAKVKKPAKPGSLRAKLEARMEMAKAMMEEQQKRQADQLKNQGQADNTMGGNRAQRRANKRKK